MKHLEKEFDYIFKYVKELNQANYEFKIEWDVYRFMIRDKMFGMLGLEKGSNLLILKGIPEENELFIKNSKSVIPGYHMNKKHWFSIKLEENEFSKDELYNFIQQSYNLVLSKLPKKVQEEINNK